MTGRTSAKPATRASFLSLRLRTVCSLSRRCVTVTLYLTCVCVCLFSDALKCAGITCPSLPVPKCPSDSVLTRSYTPPAGCCPTAPAQCTCSRCPPPPDCSDGHRAVLVKEGTGAPGNCCHTFTCQRGKELFVLSVFVAVTAQNFHILTLRCV